MKVRTVRVLAVLFCMCLLASGCDLEDVLRTAQARGVDPGGQRPARAQQDPSGPPDKPRRSDDDETKDDNDDSVDTDDGGNGEPGDDAGGDPADGEDPPSPDADGPPPPAAGSEQPESFSCDHTIGGGVNEADGKGNMSGVAPGDTVCLTAGTRGPLELHNFHGAAGTPITFVNHGGTVNIRGDAHAGIQIEHSDHLRVTGAGVEKHCGATVATGSQRCGIRILGAERGVSGVVATEHLTVDHVEMGDTSQAAFVVKDNSRGREWIAHGIALNHSYLHDVFDEGVYIGSSDYDTGDFHVVNGVQLGYNLVERTGRDGIQVGSTTQDCALHHNVVRHVGRNKDATHLKGIVNGLGSVCDIFSNVISDTAGWGIYVRGNGTNEVYNNVIVRSGRLVTTASSDGDGIAIHDGSNKGKDVYVWNNTVVSSRSEGIDWNLDATSGQIYNNLVVAAGAKAIDGGGAATRNNLAVGSVSTAGFVDAGRDAYGLRAGSPAVDAGMRLDGVTTDINDVPRPQGSGYDVGSYERRG